MSIISKAVKAILGGFGADTRTMVSPKADPEVAKAVFSGSLKAPAWAVALSSSDEDIQKAAFKAAGLDGAVVVSQGGSWDGFGAMVRAKLWAAPGAKGCPMYASTDHGKTFAWIGLRPNKEGSATAGAVLQSIDHETGAVLEEIVPQAGAGMLKLKPQAGAGGFGQDYFSAVANLEAWLASGEGKRKDLVVITQFCGNSHVAKGEYQDKIQPVSSWMILEVPRVAAGRGSFEALKDLWVAPKATAVAVAAQVVPTQTILAQAEDI